MKTLKILFLAFCVSFSSYAQDSQLFDNGWYLQSLVIDDQAYFTPINDELDYVYLSIEESNMESVVCYAINGAFEGIDNENLYVSVFFFIGDEFCDLQVNQDFESLYFNFFMAGTPTFTFPYSIEDDLISKWLTIINLNGDQAIYRGESLSNHDFNSTSFSIYPNPVIDIITIENSNHNTINKVLIYDTTGRLVLDQNNPNYQLDVSNISTGLLFVQIETDIGVVTKKVIKE